MWYELLVAAIYGIVEGVTEWLPISSTGHLILLERVLALPLRPAVRELFEVLIQLGAILAVAVIFWRLLWPFAKEKAKRRAAWALWGRVLLATLPAALMGLLLDDWITAHLFRAPVVAGALIVYGVAFLLIERYQKNRSTVQETTHISYRTALGVGLFQMLALLPGTSRSGATILGGMLLGLSRTVAAEFSFFLGIPTMLGAGALKSVKFFADGNVLTVNEAVLLTVAAATAFLVSMAVIRFLTDFVRRHSFAGFGVYRIVLGGAVLLLFLFEN